MAVLDDLLQKVSDPVLRDRLTKEIHKATKHKKFGLVFEEHLPECTLLYDVPVKIGSRVAVRDTEIKETYTVLSVKDGTVKCVSNNDKALREFPLNNLVTVAEFGEPIYPYLQTIDTVCNAPDSDLWHTLIEADNYHALQLLEYMYAGKVDCIYIDPPYNKEDSKDWKYNCNYVDGNDMYRHSKWLSMMERRLKLAKKLLNPNDSVLIITIDEKEYLHLGMLLEKMFPEAKMQMISTVINHASVARFNEFNRNNEYIYFVMFGQYELQSIDDSKTAVEGSTVAWNTLRRHSPSNVRESRPNQFYPIYINIKTKKIEKIGNPIPPEVDRHSVEQLEGCAAVFPVRENGREMLWGVVPEELRRRYKGGYVKIGKYEPDKPQQFGIQVLPSGPIRQIENGELVVDGYNDDGSVIVTYKETKKVLPKSQWDYVSHDAKTYGSNILREILRESDFPYPKSLYAVHDALKLFVGHKKRAIVVDFFAGSGTTLHAVNLLNAEDNGQRRCIMVTNNEIGAKQEEKMRKAGYRPGDSEWEAIGIAKHTTWPRTVCSIEGHDVNGKPLKGNYLGLDTSMSDGFKTNAIYFKLGFLDKNAVSLGTQFKELLSVLWMKAGSVGPCPHLDEKDVIPDMLILPQNRMAVLIDDTAFALFEESMKQHPEIETVYIVTDSDRGYREMLHALGAKNTYQLYRDYLDNFRINNRR